MDTTFDSTRYVQVFNGDIAYIAEGGNSTNIMNITVDVNMHRVSVTIECASIGRTFCPTNGPVDTNVGLQFGVNPILALGL